MLQSLADDEWVNKLKNVEIHWVNGPVSGVDGSPKKIRVAFVPAVKKRGKAPLGSLIISPGRTEYIEKYAEVIAEFTARGFAVLAVDQRGQGLSDRLAAEYCYGHMDDFTLAAKHLADAISQLESQLPKPHILLGHSMGGAIGLEMLLQSFALSIKAAVFSAPMWGLDTHFYTETVCRVRSFFGKSGVSAEPKNKYWKPEIFETSEVTSDSRRFARNNAILLANPEIQSGGATNGWVKAAYDAMNSFTADRLAKLDMPILVLSAAADTVVLPAQHARIAGLLPHAKLVSFPNAKHEILMETDDIRSKFWQVFDDWFAGLPLEP
ncbi:MAG: lysophospholipase [Hyphomonadaceae bacterium]|nr:MAG: lysophospholipase [Hyphomonadaceae bacterium]